MELERVAELSVVVGFEDAKDGLFGIESPGHIAGLTIAEEVAARRGHQAG